MNVKIQNVSELFFARQNRKAEEALACE